MHFDEEMGFQFLGPRSTVLSPSDPRPPTEFREEKQSKTGTEGAERATDLHRVGFFHTPEQFLSVAKTVAHPMHTADHIQPITRDALQFNLQHHPDLVKLERRKNLLQAKLLSKRQKKANCIKAFRLRTPDSPHPWWPP